MVIGPYKYRSRIKAIQRNRHSQVFPKAALILLPNLRSPGEKINTEAEDVAISVTRDILKLIDCPSPQLPVIQTADLRK